MSNTPPPGDVNNPADQPDYGQPDYGQPQYGQPQYDEAPYAQAAQGYGAPAPLTEPPKSVATAVTLMWASVALSVVSSLLTFTMLDTIVDKALADADVSSTVDSDAVKAGAIMGGILGLIIGVAIYVALIMFIKKGANWARIVFTVLAVIGLLFGLVGIAGQPAILMLTSLIGLALSAATLYFLWQKDSNAWFAKRV